MNISDLDMLEDLDNQSAVVVGFGRSRGSFARTRGVAFARGENTYTKVSALTYTTPDIAWARGRSIAAATNDNNETP